MKLLYKKTIFTVVSVLTFAVIAAVNISFASKDNGLSDLSLANIEAFAGTTPGEENPPQSGTWTLLKDGRVFVGMRNIAGQCYNVYTEKQVFVCGDGSDAAVCGTNRTIEDKVPCSC